MPKVKRVVEEIDRREEVSVSSVVFGLVMVIAIIVAGAALMGGSLSRMESQMANTTDGLARSVGLGVSSVTIIGLDHDPVLASDIRGAAMVEPGENMFRADPHRIAQRVEATQKVVNVRVHRLWPDQIVIMAEPARPLALHHDGTAWRVIDTLGRVIPTENAQTHANLPKLTGMGAEEAALTLITALSDEADLFEQVQFAERINTRRWKLVMDGGTVIRLPLDAELPAALAELAALDLRTELTTRRVAAIDMRVPGRLFLKPAPQANEGAA